MSILGNVLKKHEFVLEIQSPSGGFFNQLSCQKATISAKELETIELSVGNYNEKSAGRLKVGDLTLENVLLSSSEISAKYFDDWFATAENGQPIIYKKNARIIQERGGEVIGQWELIGIYPKNLGDIELDRTATESLMQTLVFSVDNWQRVR